MSQHHILSTTRGATSSMFLALAMASACCSAVAAERTDWLTGPALRKQLDQEVSVAWSGKPLREALGNLSQLHRVAILLDRRVDPSQPLELSERDVPLRPLLEVVARTRGQAVSVLDSLVYIGPPETVRRLRTIAELRKEEIAKLPAQRRLELVRLRAWKWNDLATPRELLAQVAQDARWQLGGAEQVPHDLWAAADLPPLSAADRLTLVAAQFDLTFRLEPGAESVTLVPMPKEPAIERTYPGGKSAKELAQQLAAALPNSKITVVNNSRVVVLGPLEDHERISGAHGRVAPQAASPPKSLDLVRVKFSIKSKPLKEALDQFRQQLGIEIKYDAEQLKEAGISLDQLVTLDMPNASVDELLKATLAPAGLTFKRTERVVEIMPAP